MNMRIQTVLFVLLTGLLYNLPVSFGQEGARKLITGLEEQLLLLEPEDGNFSFTGQIEQVLLGRKEAEPGYLSMEIPGFHPSGREGSPSLPQASILFEAGRGEDLQIRMLRKDSVIFDLTSMGISGRISPYMPSVQKGSVPAEPSPDQHIYQKDGWVSEPLISVSFEGIMRGVPISSIRLNPVQYNPARNLVKVFYNVSCSVVSSGNVPRKKIPSEAFSGIFSRVVMREADPAKKAVLAEAPMTLVILSDTLFRDALQPLIRWKSHKGFRVVEAYHQELFPEGTRDSLKSYLTRLYRDPPDGIAPPSFLLIVGDVQHVPLSQSGGQVTDLYYAEYDGGGDYIPDLFYGRISVDSPAQLQSVVEKILLYERYLFPDPSYLNESVLIAGVDGSFASTHGNGQIRYASDYYLNEANGNTVHAFYYPESGSSDQQILDLISGGVGFVNYTGHGEYDRWTDPTFHQSSIDGLGNQGKYPVMIGNGCETNVFSLGECFAEALLRAPGRGALAYIGCTNDSYWDEDYYWAVGVGPIVSNPDYDNSSQGFYDRVFHTHSEPYELWTPSLGEMIFGGNMSVQQSFTSRKKFYWEIYQLAGDPTIVPWVSTPGTRDVNHRDILPVGTDRMDVVCAPYDYVSVSRNGFLLDAKHSAGVGYVTLYLPDTLSAGSLDLVVTGQSFVPYFGQVELGQPEGAYLDLHSYNLSDETVEADQLISNDEMVAFDMRLINRGSADLEGDTLVMFSNSPGVEVVDSLVSLDRLPAGDTLTLQNVFRIRAYGDAADQSQLILGLFRSGDHAAKPQFLKERIHAPVMVSGGIGWDDRSFGNGNGIADEGEWLVFEWRLFNKGHFRTGEISGTLLNGTDPLLDSVTFGTLEKLDPGDSAILEFMAQAGPGASGWRRAGPVIAGDQHAGVVDSFFLVTGRYFEDFHLSSPTVYPFVNNSSSPWKTDPGTFSSSPRSFRSGPIPDHGSSELSISVEVTEPDSISFMRRVSSEPGYDYLRFYVDSVLVQSWSGEKEWGGFSFPLDPGVHEVSWTYMKDQSIGRGQDAAWIDDIIFPSTAFRSSDVALLEIKAPVSGPWLTGQENVSLVVSNTGLDTLDQFFFKLYFEGELHWTDTVRALVPPGEGMEIAVQEPVDLSGRGSYVIQASVSTPGDRFTGNNSLAKRIDHYDYPDIGLEFSELEGVDGVYQEVIVIVENRGNVPIDSLLFETVVTGIHYDTGTRFIGLQPSGALLESFRLIDSTGTVLTSGFYEYAIRSLADDSVASNNEIFGNLFWTVLGEPSVEKSSGAMLFPNPAREGFHLVLDRPAAHDLKLEMVSLGGEIVFSMVMNKGMTRIFIPSGGRSGNFLLKVGDLTVPVVLLE